MNFAVLVWGYECECIIKLPKKAIRIISLSKYNAHTKPVFKTLKLLKVKDILTLQELKFYYKYKHNKLPHYLQHFPIMPNSETHIYETRIQNEIHLSKTQHEYAKLCIRVNLPKIINSTPIEIISKIDTHSIQGFSG